MVQIDTSMDERIKILYALFFMLRGIVQVWAENETNMILYSMSRIRTLGALLS